MCGSGFCGAGGTQVMAWVPVPPVTVTVAVPSQSPLQPTGVVARSTIRGSFCSTSNTRVVSQAPEAIVTVHWPAHRPLTDGVPSPMGDPLQSNVYDPVPPVTLRSIVPSQSPAQVMGPIVASTMIGSGAATVNVVSVAHPSASCTVSVYACAHNPVTLLVPWPVPGAGSQKKVGWPAPPETVTVAVPSQVPGQVAGVVCRSRVMGSASSMVIGTTSVHPLPSVMVTVTGPAQKPSATAVPWPPFRGAGSHSQVRSGTPPSTEMLTTASHAPGHETGSMVGTACRASGPSITMVRVVSHPLASVISRSYTAAHISVGAAVPWPCPGDGVHTNRWSGVPPATVTVAVPSQSPAQVTSVEVKLASSAGGACTE